jgi:hypothetical protein
LCSSCKADQQASIRKKSFVAAIKNKWLAALKGQGRGRGQVGAQLRQGVMESSSGREKRTFMPKSGMMRMKVRGPAAH